MEMRTLMVEELSEHVFDDFGSFVHTAQQDPAAQLAEFSFWNKLAVLNLTIVSIGMVEAHPQSKMVSTTFEQHERTTESLIPAGGDVVLVLAKSIADAADQIDLQSVRAFRLKAGDAVVLNPGVWHFAPLALRKSVKVWVLFENDTPVNDVRMRHVDKEDGVTFIVEGA